jgi:hypothetical protein
MYRNLKKLSKKVNVATRQTRNHENEVLGVSSSCTSFRLLPAERFQGEGALLTFKLPSASWQVCRALVSGETRICTQIRTETRLASAIRLLQQSSYGSNLDSGVGFRDKAKEHTQDSRRVPGYVLSLNT